MGEEPFLSKKRKVDSEELSEELGEDQGDDLSSDDKRKLEFIMRGVSKEMLAKAVMATCEASTKFFTKFGEKVNEYNKEDSSLTKIFVVGFTKETVEDDLLQLFSEFGPIKDVHIVRDSDGISKSFGFVTFEAIENAMAALEQPTKSFQERELHCKLSAIHVNAKTENGPMKSLPFMDRDGDSMTREEDFALRKLFCRGVNPSTSEDRFREFFEQFGELENSNLAVDKATNAMRGYGFVVFSNRLDSIKCLESTQKILDGKELIVNIAEKDPRLCGGCSGKEEALRKVFIRGIQPDMTDDDLLNAFSEYGEIESCSAAKEGARSKNYGFCIFKSPVSAMKCIEHPKIEINGATLHVNLAQFGRKARDLNMGGNASLAGSPVRSYAGNMQMLGGRSYINAPQAPQMSYLSTNPSASAYQVPRSYYILPSQPQGHANFYNSQQPEQNTSHLPNQGFR